MSSSTGQLSSDAAYNATPGKLPRSATTSREEGVNIPAYRAGLSHASEVGPGAGSFYLRRESRDQTSV